MVDNPVQVALSGQDWGTRQGQRGLNRSPNPMQEALWLHESRGLASPSVHRGAGGGDHNCPFSLVLQLQG